LPAADFVRLAAERGVRMNAIGPQRVRAVTHLDVSARDVERALSALSTIARR